MLLKNRLHKLLSTPTSKVSGYWVVFWFGLSLTVAVIYSYPELRQVLSNKYALHDDVRSHVFWMQRFLEPDLFPQDIIADYFQSVAPDGYTGLYRLMAIGIDPLLFNKILPLFLALITTAYCFGVCMEIFPFPAAGFIATVFINQTLWTTPEVPSGTPRSFFYPLFLAFLYYLLRRSLIPCLGSLVLQGLFYPHCLLISAGVLILQLFRLDSWRLRLSRQRSDYLFCATGLGAIALMLLPLVLKVSEFGSVITAAEAKTLPIFQSSGRKPFFYDNPVQFWFCAERSSIFPYEWCTHTPPLQVWAGLLLPLLLWFPTRFPQARLVSDKVAILPISLLASLGIFFAAHALLFKLHLPSRYTKHSLRILVAIAAGIALIIILDAVFSWAKQQARNQQRGRQFLALGLVGLLTGLIFLNPILLHKFSDSGYKQAKSPALYEFFAQQPKDSLIASLSSEANNIPTFSRRSVLASSEIHVPYHKGYSQQIEQRAVDLIRAQYSHDLVAIKQTIQKYGIDFLLLEQASFTPEYIERDSWLLGFQPAAAQAVENLKQGVPAVARLSEQCSVYKTKNFVVLQAECILKAKQD